MLIGGLFKSFSESINRAVPLILWTSHNTCAYEPNPTSVSHSLTCDSFQSIGELGRAMAMIRKNCRTTIIYKIRKSCKLRLSKVLKRFDLILLNFSDAQLLLICAFSQVRPKNMCRFTISFYDSFSLLCCRLSSANNTIRGYDCEWYHSPLEVLASSPHPILTQPWIIWAATSTKYQLRSVIPVNQKGSETKAESSNLHWTSWSVHKIID